jgi:hypothetical protein
MPTKKTSKQMGAEEQVAHLGLVVSDNELKATARAIQTAILQVVRTVILILRACPKYRLPFCRALG